MIVEHQLDVLAQRDGVIAELRSEAGAHVHAGDLLARSMTGNLLADLEAARAKTRSIEADLRNWQAEAKVMQSDYERAQKMWDAHIDQQSSNSSMQSSRRNRKPGMSGGFANCLPTTPRRSDSLELELEKTSDPRSVFWRSRPPIRA